MGGMFSRQRAESVSLAEPAPSSPTASAASSQRNNSSASTSPLSGPDSPPHSPTSLGLPSAANAKTYLLGEPHPDSGSDSSDSDLEAGNGDDTKFKPSLSFCGLVRANVAAQYEKFAMTKVGLVTRAFLMSLPQSLALSAALGFAFSGLVTPIVFKKGSASQIQTYFFLSTLASSILPSTAVIYDTYHRLVSHFNHGSYNSFGIFRLRALFMGAALGDTALRTILYDWANSKSVWLNFALTLPATLLPAYVRFTGFKHDIVPPPLDKNDTIPPQHNQTRSGILGSRAFSVASAACVSASSGLVFYRAINTVMLDRDSRSLTMLKVLSALIPGILGGSAKFFEKSNPAVSYRWKQFEILAGDAAIIFGGISGAFPNPANQIESPDYWWGTLSYVVFGISLVLSAVQASRVVQKTQGPSVNCLQNS